MTDLSVANFVVYSAQVLLVVTAATIGAHVVGPSAPRPRLVFWRAVIILCLLLPLSPARRVDVVTTSATVSAAQTVDVAFKATGPPPMVPLSFVPWLLLSGAAARGAWLGLGFLRLRRLRVRSVPASLGYDIEALKRTLAPHADLRWHEDVNQPLTFGLGRPIVLLPRGLLDLPPEAQRAVVCHELLHVSRRDWAWTLFEEAVQTAFWFHPAMWWALGQVHLSREETVDDLVVAITRTRRPYMNALMLFAEARPAQASAIPYVRRRHLASRIKRLSKETTMSTARLALTCAALLVVIPASSLGVVLALPLHASAPAAAQTATAQAGQLDPVLVAGTDEATFRRFHELVLAMKKLEDARNAYDAAQLAKAGPPLKPVSNEPLTMRFVNAPLTRILGFIGGATGITITYENGFVDLPKVTVDFQDALLGTALNQVLGPNQLSYKVVDERTILIVRQAL